MNIDDAVKVLRKHEYRKKKTWALWADGMVIGSSAGQSGIVELTGFEAIAIAEKLERDAGRDMPATRKLMRFIRDYADHFHGKGIGYIFFTTCDCDQNEEECGHDLIVSRDDLDAALAELEGKP